MPVLSQATGLAFETDKKAGEEVLILKVNQVKLKDLMAKIADVASAQWTKNENGYRLERPIELDRQLRKAEVDAIKKRISTEYTKALQVEVKKESQPVSDLQRYIAVSNDMSRLLHDHNEFNGDEINRIDKDYFELRETIAKPIARLLAEALNSLDPSKIAALGPGDRIVYSTSPNRVQYGFSISRTAVRRYETARTIIAQLQPATSDQTDDELSRYLSDLPLLDYEPIDKALLFVERDSQYPQLDYSLYLVGPTGKLIDKDTFRINLWSPNSLPSLYGQKKRVTWSADSRELIADSTRDYESPSKTSKELRRRLIDPERFDPLSFLASDCWMNLTEAHQVNLVGSLPDEAISVPDGPIVSYTAADFQKELQDGSEVQAQVSGG